MLNGIAMATQRMDRDGEGTSPIPASRNQTHCIRVTNTGKVSGLREAPGRDRGAQHTRGPLGLRLNEIRFRWLQKERSARVSDTFVFQMSDDSNIPASEPSCSGNARGTPKNQTVVADGCRMLDIDKLREAGHAAPSRAT